MQAMRRSGVDSVRAARRRYASAMLTTLVERESQLETLHRTAADSVRHGSLVFVVGEAGHGKTSLIDYFLATLDHRFRVIHVACEPLGRPLAFGPILGAADDLPETVRIELEQGAERPAVYREMARAIRSDPTVLVVEDVHWADEATLGLVRHLGRKIADTASILIVSVRPEEIDPAHPFRVLTADIGRQAVRLDLPPLTPQGVRTMTSGTGLDPATIHATTLGNPFFVEELVRNPDFDLPATVVEAIESIIGGLADDVRDVVELVSLTADGLDVALMESVEAAVDVACQRRLLAVSGSRIRCRHELIRAAVDEAIPPLRRRRIHRALVRMFEQSAEASHERTALLAYHSHEAGLGEETVRYAVEAAGRAAAVGSHREAARAYGWAYEHRRSIPQGELRAVLQAAAYEHLLVNDFSKAIEIAMEMTTSASDEHERAEADAWVAFFALRYGDVDLAAAHVRSALSVLEGSDPTPALARAHTAEAVIQLSRGASNGIELAQRAVETARRTRAAAIEADGLITLGTALAIDGSARGYDLIEEGGHLAREVRSFDAAARAVNNLGALPFREMRLGEAAAAMDEGLQFLAAEQLDAWYVAVEATRAHISVLQCEWDVAKDALDRVLPRRTCLSTEAEATLIVALCVMRIGDPTALAAVDVGLARADQGGGHAERVMAAEVAMEAAWMGLLDPGSAADRYSRMIDRAVERGDAWSATRLAFWALRLGLEPPTITLPGPVADEIAGDPVKAATRWRELGYPVEAAITEAFAPDVSLREIFDRLEALGAHGTAAGLRRRLRASGVSGIPRGAQRVTDAHPAGLTARQQDVLALVAAGYSNDSIADELFISAKTVSHHVSAILAKLGVDSRVQAASVAHTNSWV